MSLNVGTLKAVLTLDDSEFNTRIQRAPQALTSLDQAVSQTGARMSGKLGQAGEQGGRQFGSKLSSAATASASAAGDKAGQGFGQRFSSSLSSAVSNASQELQSKLGVSLPTSAAAIGVTAGAALGAAMFKGWNRLTSIENAQAKLSGLGNSAQDVAAIMQNAMAAVKGTAFGMDEAASTAAGAVAAGIKPGQDLQKTLTLVGDSATIAGMGMTEMGAIWNKVAASNKIQGDVIAQLNDAGIPIVQLLGKELGKTAEETLNLASKGEINFETFRAAMEKGLGGAAQKSGETVSGAFKNMGAAVSRFGALLAQPVFDRAGGVMGGITEGIDGAGKAVKAAQGAFDSIPAPVQSAVTVFAALKLASMALGTEMGQKLTSPVRNAASAIASSTGNLTGNVGAWRNLSGELKQTAPALNAVQRNAMALSTGTGAIGKMGTAFMDAAAQAKRMPNVMGAAAASWQGAKSAASGLSNVLGGPLGIGIMAATALWVSHSNEVAKAKAQTEQIGAAVSDTATVLSSTGGKYSEAGQQAAAAALETIKLKDGTTSLGEALSKANIPLDQAAKGLAGMGDAAEKTREQLKDAHEQAADQMGLWDRIKQDFFDLDIRTPFSGPKRNDEYDTEYSDALAAYDKARESIKKKQDAIKREAEAGGYKLEVAVDGTVALDGMVESLKEFESNAKGAAAGVDILTGALNKLSDDQFTVHDAQARLNESFRELKELAGTLGNVGLDGSGLIDTKTKEGATADKAARQAAEGYKELAASLYESGLRGQGLTDALRPQYDQFLNLATAMLGSREQAETLAKSLGLIPTDVQVNLDIKNAANTKTVLDSIGDQFKSFDGTTSTITVTSLSDQAKTDLEGIGFTVEQIPGTKEFTIVPNTKAAFDALDGLRGKYDGIPAVKPITIETPGYEGVMAGLEQLGIKVHSDNEKHIVIADNSPETIARLSELGIKTTTLPNGKVVITDNSVDIAGNIDRNLSGKQTTGSHTIYVNEVMSGTGTTGTPRAAVGQHYGADGGLRGIGAGAWMLPFRKRASGMLDTAHIVQGQGQGIFAQTPLGNVQYGEGETVWEAYIPGAQSKRTRSLAILKETARRFGYGLVNKRDVMADGGMRVDRSAAEAYAKAHNGEGYVYGALDCSGYLSGIYSKLTGKNVRFTTASDFAALGFVPGYDPNGFSVGTNGGVGENGHMAGTLYGTNVESASGAGIRYGSGAQGATDFPEVWHLPEASTGGDNPATASGGGQQADGQRVFVTNWPSGAGYGGGSGSSGGSAPSGAGAAPAPTSSPASNPIADAIDGVRALLERGDYTSSLSRVGVEEDDPRVIAALGLRSLLANGEFTQNLREAFGVEEDDPRIVRWLGLRAAANGQFDQNVRETFGVEEDDPRVAAAFGVRSLLADGQFTGNLRDAFGVEEDDLRVAATLGVRSLLKDGDFTANLRDAFQVEEDDPRVVGLLDLRKAIVDRFPHLQPMAIEPAAPDAPAPTDQVARENPPEVKSYEVKTPQERMAEWTEQAGQEWLDSFGLKPGGAIGALIDAGKEPENVRALEQMVEVLRVIAEDPPVQVVINAKDGDDAVRKWQEYIGGKSLSWIK
ncbi:tape measure protein [Rhodococcus hoagii]|nr:tape measure protein [Prescottella equi]